MMEINTAPSGQKYLWVDLLQRNPHKKNPSRVEDFSKNLYRPVGFSESQKISTILKTKNPDFSKTLKERVKAQNGPKAKISFLSLIDELSYKEWAKEFEDKGPEIMDFNRFYADAKALGEEGLKSFWKKFFVLIGQEWEVKAKVKLNADDEGISTNGYHSLFAQGHLANIVQKYFNEIPQNLPAHAADILEALRLAPIYGQDVGKAQEIVDRIKAGKPTVLATGWRKHTTQIIFFDKYVAYINLGDRSEDLEAGITILTFGDKELLTIKIVKQIQDTVSEKQGSSIGKKFLESTKSAKGLFKNLNLRKKATIPMQEQLFGTCAWSAAVGGFYALLTISKKINAPPVAWHKFLVSDDFLFVSDQFDEMIWKSREKMLNIFFEAQEDPGHLVKFSVKEYFRLLSSFLFKLGLEESDEESYSPDVKKIQKRIFNNIMKRIKDNNIPIENCIFKFRGQQSEDFLQQMPEGSFCLRKRKGEKGSYALDVGQGIKKEVCHYKIEKFSTGKFLLFDGSEYSQVKNIRELLKFEKLKFPAFPDVESERIKKHSRWSKTQFLPFALKKKVKNPYQDILPEHSLDPSQNDHLSIDIHSAGINIPTLRSLQKKSVKDQEN